MGKGIGRSLGGIAGGVGGFVLSGFNPMGAMAGYTAGSALGGALDPAKVKAPGAPGVGNDIKSASQKYSQNFDAQAADARARQQAANSPAVIAQMSQAALGQGPSLAEAQLKSATNRNLAQQLAMAASMRGRNPAAAQRQILNSQGDAGRQLAEQSSIARLQEQQMARQQLASQQAMADQLAMSGNQQGFSAATLPGTMKYQGQLAQMQAQAAANAANAQAQNSMTSGLLSAGAQLGAAYMGMPASPAAAAATTASPAVTYDINRYTGGGGAGMGGVNATRMSSGGFATGGRVPGTPEVDSNSPANDKVQAMLSPGEIVIPRSHATSLAKAKSFVQTLMEKEKSLKPRTKQSDMPQKRKSLASVLAKKD